MLIRRFLPEDAEGTSGMIAASLRVTNGPDYSAEEIEELVEDLGSGKWEEASLSELSKLNQRLYRDVTEACYGDSYANPAVAVRRLGEE